METAQPMDPYVAKLLRQNRIILIVVAVCSVVSGVIDIFSGSFGFMAIAIINAILTITATVLLRKHSAKYLAGNENLPVFRKTLKTCKVLTIIVLTVFTVCTVCEILCALMVAVGVSWLPLDNVSMAWFWTSWIIEILLYCVFVGLLSWTIHNFNVMRKIFGPGSEAPLKGAAELSTTTTSDFGDEIEQQPLEEAAVIAAAAVEEVMLSEV